MKHRRLSVEELLRLTLARQGLAERVPKATPAEAVERFGPLHATDRATPYLSLLARIVTFAFADLDRAWLLERQLDRRSAMRGTFHLLPRTRLDTVICVFGVRDPAEVRYLRQAGVAPSLAKRLRKAVETVIANHGPTDVAGLKRVLREPLRTAATAKTKDGGTTLAAVLRWMAEAGILASAARRDPRTGAIQGGWAHAPLVYERFETAFGEIGLCRQRDADGALARWYFEAHGPAAFEDWAWWTALPARRARAAFETLRRELEEIAVEDWPVPLYLPTGTLDQTARGAPGGVTRSLAEPVVRLLPYEDSSIKAYRATRQRFFDPVLGERSHTLYGEVMPTILVDGRVAGTWSSGVGGWSAALGAAAGRPERGLSAELFGRVDPAVRRALDKELARVRSALDAAWRDGTRVDAPAGGG